MNLFFFLFASITVLSAIAVISSRNPVHSVLFLILAFVNSAGLFVLAGAEFLAMILLIVYVGAVAVLFLFVVMMLNISLEEIKNQVKKYFYSGLFVGLVLMAELFFSFSNLDLIAKSKLRTEIKKIAKILSITVFIVTHDIFDALDICDEIIFINNGELIETCSSSDVKNLSDIKLKSYLKNMTDQAKRFISIIE